MAERLTTEQSAALSLHLERFPNAQACPICNCHGWRVIGLEASHAIRAEDDPPTIHRAGVFPVVTLVCRTCGYTRSIAWSFVRAASAPKPPAM